jgi:putative heme-binding domain-containing protein
VTFKDDETVSGFIVSRAGNGVTLKIPGGERREIPEKDIKNISTARATLMPEGLLENLSAEEAGDLFAFLSARK